MNLPPGPWDNEPDKLEFEFDGVPCRITRNDSFGNLCGYAALTEYHPYFKCGYNNIHYNVHGGLTFCGFQHSENSLWWIGFDCAHSDDVIPSFDKINFKDATYKTIDFVKSELTKLVKQINEELCIACLHKYSEHQNGICSHECECAKLLKTRQVITG
jgi:hypothetical protein